MTYDAVFSTNHEFLRVAPRGRLTEFIRKAIADAIRSEQSVAVPGERFWVPGVPLTIGCAFLSCAVA